MTGQEDDNSQNNGGWGRLRIVIILALVATTSYEMGLSHARSERSAGEYSALRTQYDRIETQSTELRAQYDRVLAGYSESKTQCSETLTKYSALMKQYERIEARNVGASRQ